MIRVGTRINVRPHARKKQVWGKVVLERVIVILFVSVASGQSVEILFVFKSPFWTKKYKNVEFYRLKSLHFRYISKISKFRTKISDLGNFLYGICRFYAIYTKTTLTLQVQTKLSRKRELQTVDKAPSCEGAFLVS